MVKNNCHKRWCDVITPNMSVDDVIVILQNLKSVFTFPTQTSTLLSQGSTYKPTNDVVRLTMLYTETWWENSNDHAAVDRHNEWHPAHHVKSNGARRRKTSTCGDDIEIFTTDRDIQGILHHRRRRWSGRKGRQRRRWSRWRLWRCPPPTTASAVSYHAHPSARMAIQSVRVARGSVLWLDAPDRRRRRRRDRERRCFGQVLDGCGGRRSGAVGPRAPGPGRRPRKAGRSNEREPVGSSEDGRECFRGQRQRLVTSKLNSSHLTLSSVLALVFLQPGEDMRLMIENYTGEYYRWT